MMKVNKSNRTKIAMLLSLIPGLGQIFNKQYLKGIIFLVFTASFFFVFKDLLNIGLWGIVTLGTEVPRDNSVFLLAEGLIAILVLFLFGIFYVINLFDAKEFQRG